MKWICTLVIAIAVSIHRLPFRWKGIKETNQQGKKHTFLSHICKSNLISNTPFPPFSPLSQLRKANIPYLVTSTVKHPTPSQSLKQSWQPTKPKTFGPNAITVINGDCSQHSLNPHLRNMGRRIKLGVVRRGLLVLLMGCWFVIGGVKWRRRLTLF